MGKIVKFSVVDAAGAAAAGQKVIAGTIELTTGSTGFAQVLLDDGATMISVNGVKAYEGSVEELRPVEV